MLAESLTSKENGDVQGVNERGCSHQVITGRLYYDFYDYWLLNIELVVSVGPLLILDQLAWPHLIAVEIRVLDDVLADILAHSLVIQDRVRLVQLPTSSLVIVIVASSNPFAALTYLMVALAQKVPTYLVVPHVMHYWSVVAIDA